MQLFIWDDRNYRLIEEGEKYDDEKFTVVRKLFVRYNAYTADPAEEIRGAFEDYGDVESVKIVKASSHNDEGENVEGLVHEAYVTFKQSADAYQMVKSLVVPENVIGDPVPADTWHQPDYNDSIHLMGYFREGAHKCGKVLNDSMADVSYSFEELSLRGNEILCNQTVMEFELELKPGVTLAEMRRMLRCLMPQVCHFKLSLCDGFGCDTEEDCVKKHYFCHRALQVIGVNAVGPKLKQMTISGFGEINENLLKCLAPALKQLEALTIDTECFNVLYLLQTFCPNLESLDLFAEISQEEDDEETAPVQLWPTLTELALNDEASNTEIGTQNSARLCRFFSLNPQLRMLDFSLKVDNSLLKIIADNMRELDTLAFFRANFEDADEAYTHLIRLEHLESIRITTSVLKACHFKSLLVCIERFSQMKRLGMAALQQNFTPDNTDESIILKHFPITHHQDCICHGRDNQVLTFGNHTEPISLPKDKQTLAISIGVAGDLKSANDTLNTRIFSLFDETKKFYPNVHKTTIIQEDDQYVFLYIASTL